MGRRSANPLIVAGLCVVATCSDPAPTTGTLIVEIAGLPASVPGAVVVTGPSSFRRTVQSTTTLEGLQPGAYVVSSGQLTTATALYQPEAPTHNASVAAGQTSTVQFLYALASGSIDLTASGLPDGVGPVVSIGSATYVRNVSSAGLIHAIPAGQYTVRADTFASASGDRFGAAVVEQSVTITPSETPVPVSLTYGPASGTLNLVVTGLSVSANDAISVTGAGGFSVQTSNSVLLRGLRPGAYTVTPRQVVQCPTVFTATTPAHTLDIALAQVTEARVSYESAQPGPETLNLSIASAYLTQAVQSVDGSIPIIAGRPAVLRVFGIANQCNAVAPSVRVRFSDGDSITIAAPQSSVGFAPVATQLGTSWNALLPAERVKAGLSFEVEIDADHAIFESDESDNIYPRAGQSTPVVDVPAFDVAFIPISQAGATGDVRDSNLPEYLRAVRQMLPLGVINPTIEPVLTTNIILGNGSASTFDALLQELETKRVSDGATAHYYGVLMPAPGITFVQVGGIAYIGGRTALGISVGWFNDSRQARELVAHELSHNFGQRHAPCGGAGGPDPSYPYPGGVIGVPGYDLSTATSVTELAIKAPSQPDILGYCSDPWISDYMYRRIMNFRGPPVVAVAAEGQSLPHAPTLLVSGMISPDSVRLDPAFHVTTRPVLPASAGPDALEGRAADGRVLFRTPFHAQPTDHGNPLVRHFTYAIPLSDADATQLASVELTGGASGRRALRRAGGSAQRLRIVAAGAAVDAAGVTVSSRSATLVDVEWDATRWPGILVREPTTKALLAVGRAGRTRVTTSGRSVELVLSDGAHSVVLQSPIAGR